VKIEICKWYNNANSPVLFMVDDFANVWIDTNGNGEVDLEEDWGYAKNSKNSSFNFLNEVILKDYPDLKVTFFTPVGVRAGMIKNSRIKTISKMINCDVETKSFFKSVNDNPKYEIAYHGTTHGKACNNVYDFKQEWELFNSLDEAVKTINMGQEVYKDVFGYYPLGGKYCGYKINEFSDKSIDNTDFLWWCRFWNKGLIEDENCIIGGMDLNPLTNLDIKIFGVNNVIDIPSTLYGGLFTGIFTPNIKTIKGIAKLILRKYLINKKLKEIQYLLKNKLVISIQEHISPTTNVPHESEDFGRQTPNIFDDEKSLKYIFNYIKDKNVWYCTGTELAEYYYMRENIEVLWEGKDMFKMNFPKEKTIINKKISITFDEDSIKKVVLPSGINIGCQNNIFNITVMDGSYKVIRKRAMQ
jgi:hypothetical protein